MANRYDVIVVGARVAGAATALLLARRGLRVLVVDRARFPSDTLSTHQVQLPGAARLARWGLLERVIASGAPPARQVRFDPGPAVLTGRFPAFQGVDAVYSPRRTVLDSILVDAAREAGAEVRERFDVTEVLGEDGRVFGIRGRERGGAEHVERAGLVVGADGKHSLVARTVGAAAYHVKPTLTAACYTYWDGVPFEGGEIYTRHRRAVGAWPTNDGLLMTYIAWPNEEFSAFRSDLEGNVLATLDSAGDLGERVRDGRRVERFRATPDLPNLFRAPFGPGWVLAGDAGLVLDPISGEGIGHALRDAELITAAVCDGVSGRRPLAAGLAAYRDERDRHTLPKYEFTAQVASFDPPRPEAEVLYAALAANPDELQRFLGVVTGAVPLPEYLTTRNLFRVIGASGMAKVLLNKLPRPRLAEYSRSVAN